MGIRQILNEHPSTVVIAAGVLLAGVLGLILWSSASGPGAATRSGSIERAFYTVDDGATWFEDDRRKPSPFDRNGTPAFRAYIFRCGEQGKPFVAYLERTSADAVEVKKPKDAGWVKLETPAGALAITPKCPNGDAGPIQPVLPEQ
jgi:hypothetical protein